MTKAGLAKYLESMARVLLIGTAVNVLLFVLAMKLGIFVGVAVAGAGGLVMAHFEYRERLAWDVCPTCDEIHEVGVEHEGEEPEACTQQPLRRLFSVFFRIPFSGIHGAIGCSNCAWNMPLICGVECYESHAIPKDMADAHVRDFEAHRCEDHIPVLSTDPDDRLGVG